ncbi:Hypothetical predicted protein [Olea europaea subsp. europaea]|uniref:DUF1985 domain-containing protein n=1 Tax=Olea europaea subsp. europaea TaxID=158383 RepID=A0A8S0UYC2_OLEEU|nr:Hypothetical predicted protein [Olea europaea subsp. europaea]
MGSTEFIRFRIQEYALVTGLRYGLLPDDNVMERVLEKMRLKDKYFKHVDKISCAQLEKTFLRSSMPPADQYKLGLALIIEGVFNALDNNVGIDMEILSIIDNLDLFFSYPWGRILYGSLIRDFRGHWARKFLDVMEKKEKIWAFEKVSKIGDRFCRRLSERSPRLLVWTSTKQPQQGTYDAFFKNVKLHVYATLHPTEVERGQPHIATLVSFNDHHVPALDDLVRDSVAPQFHAERLDTPEEGTSEDETSDEAHEGSETSGEEEESGADDSGEAEDEDSEDHDSRDSDGDRARRSGQTRTFFTPYVHRATLPCRHHPPLMPDQL